MKDWRKAGDYKGFNAKTKRKRWAWEFLRRNPEYQKAWDRELQAYQKANLENFINPANYNKAKYRRLLADQHKQVAVLTGKTAITEADKWGLTILLNPVIDDFKKAESESGIASVWLKKVGLPISLPGRVLDKSSDAPFFEYKESEAVAVFDLTRPLQPQLKRVHNKLLVQQKEFNVKDRRRLIDEWVRYLRLLDAVAAGMRMCKTKDVDQIAKILLPKISNDYQDFIARHTLKHNYNSAIQLTENPFKNFPDWEE